MRIVITGSPGTGKTKVASLLAKTLDLELIDIKKIAKDEGIVSGKEHEVDLKKLGRALAFLKRKNNYVIEGHLACELKIPADFIFILRCHPRVLRKRLAKRRYPKKKLEENLMAEMLDYCTQRVEQEYGKNPLELETAKLTPKEAAEKLRKAVKQKKTKLDFVDYSEELKRFLELRR